MADHDYDAIQRVAKDFETQKASHHLIQCDVTDPNQVRDLFQQADDFAGLTSDMSLSNCDQGNIIPAATLLVNCAGITRDNWISQMELDEWDEVLEVNLKGTYLTCRQFMDKRRADKFFPKIHHGDAEVRHPRPEASIVNIGSIVSELGNLGQVNYAASKGGVLGLSRALAKEVAIRNVRVNSVVPGFVDTPMAQAVPAHVKDRIMNQIPMKRFGTSSEVANVVTFLLSPRSGYVTGESVTVSGMISL
jgi:NAD(P)-dependent dehydrogenase (short-subunit alcohol dehydrogenase family)